MAWVRIHDGALTHPKLVGLSDKAFRLWVWGLCYCQMHLTDGAIPAAAIPQPVRTATVLSLAKLWDARDDGGFDVHDYLDWNDSKALVTKKRTEAKERMANARSRTNKEVRENFYVGLGDLSTKDPEKEEIRKNGAAVLAPPVSLRPESEVARAANILSKYRELYQHHRHGARLRLMGNSLEFEEACSLVREWTDERLEKLAVLVLTTNDPYIADTDRSFKIFALKATWADDKLKAWELKNGIEAAHG